MAGTKAQQNAQAARLAAAKAAQENNFLILLVLVWGGMYAALSFVKKKWPQYADHWLMDILSLINGVLFSFAVVRLLNTSYDNFKLLKSMGDPAATAQATAEAESTASNT